MARNKHAHGEEEGENFKKQHWKWQNYRSVSIVRTGTKKKRMNYNTIMTERNAECYTLQRGVQETDKHILKLLTDNCQDCDNRLRAGPNLQTFLAVVNEYPAERCIFEAKKICRAFWRHAHESTKPKFSSRITTVFWHWKDHYSESNRDFLSIPVNRSCEERCLFTEHDPRVLVFQSSTVLEI